MVPGINHELLDTRYISYCLFAACYGAWPINFLVNKYTGIIDVQGHRTEQKQMRCHTFLKFNMLLSNLIFPKLPLHLYLKLKNVFKYKLAKTSKKKQK